MKGRWFCEGERKRRGREVVGVRRRRRTRASGVVRWAGQYIASFRCAWVEVSRPLHGHLWCIFMFEEAFGLAMISGCFETNLGARRTTQSFENVLSSCD